MLSILRKAVPRSLGTSLRAILRQERRGHSTAENALVSTTGANAVVQSVLPEFGRRAAQVGSTRLGQLSSTDWLAAAGVISDLIQRSKSEERSALSRTSPWQALAYCYRAGDQPAAASAVVAEGMRWVRHPQKLLAQHVLDVRTVQTWVDALDVTEQHIVELSDREKREVLRKTARAFLIEYKRKTTANELARIRGAKRFEELYTECDLPDRPSDLLIRIELAEFYSGADVVLDLARRLASCSSGKRDKLNATIGMALHRLGRESEAYRHLNGVPAEKLGRKGRRALAELERVRAVERARKALHRAIDSDANKGLAQASRQDWEQALHLAQPHLSEGVLEQTFNVLVNTRHRYVSSISERATGIPTNAKREAAPVFCAGFRWSGGSAVFDYLSDCPQVARFWSKPRFFQDSEFSVKALRDACQCESSDLRFLVNGFVACHVLGIDVSARTRKQMRLSHARSLLSQFSSSSDVAVLDFALANFLHAVIATKNASSASTEFPVAEFTDFFAQLLQIACEVECSHVLLDSVIRAPNADLLELVPGARMVAAIRDPRDMYVTHVERGGWTRGVEDYIRTLKESWSRFDHARRSVEDQVYLVRFERFVEDEQERRRLLDWLGIGLAGDAKETLRNFVPEQSRENIGVYRSFHDQAAIAEIEQAFPDLCHSSARSGGDPGIVACTFSAMASRRQQDGEMRMCGKPGDPGWAHRREITARLIADRSYDFVGLQHCHMDTDPKLDAAGWFQARLLEKGLNYGVINRAHGKNPDRGDSTPLYYRRSRWELVDNDYGAVHYRTHQPPASEPGGGGRLFIYGRFREKGNGNRSVYVYNIRLRDQHTALNDRYRAACIRELLNHIASREDSQAPVIVLGDTNCKRVGTEADRLLMGQTSEGEEESLPTLNDAYVAVHPGSHGTVKTQHNFTDPGSIAGSERNDRILFAGALSVHSAEILTFNENGGFPSYHYPVEARFVWDRG